ncbi:STAS/SEC14 domain-containing protein [Altererythrobacter arenosus]|uniref:STAS/SEC14 domain-containing protein n=1 Tax=Altererythrobacter arenosus TaxID=3032592 RepID=A0ABY8FRN4_9SPHN|nr:STAS/SEC14 domain-containing protein [Altererythrobacter sp. CAU 1644]WFL77678.1 STAS/SEC14 domain-containing protein [Altererythrobacter sp. CAU 1644]
MYKKLDSPPNVLAYSFSGKLTAQDVDAIYDECLTALREHDRVNVFAEAFGDFEFGGEAIWRDLTRVHEMFGHFRQFDRIAFVAKPSWIQRIARLEESILAFFDFNMHVFDPSQREYAMAWARGEVEDRDAPSVRELPSDDPDIAIFEIDGKIRKRDMQVSKEILTRFLDDRQPRKLMAIVKDFSGFEVALLADRELIRMKLEAAKHLDRYAFVGAPKWLEGYIDAMDAIMKPEMKTFDADERDEAVAWLKEEELVA